MRTHLPAGMTPCLRGDNTLHRGGICRFVLAKTDPAEQADLERAIAGVNTSIAMLSAFVATGLELSGEMPHKLLHFIVDPQFQSSGVAFASPYVATEVVKRIAQDRNMEVRLLISASSGVQEFAALRGLLFEQVAHSTLPRGGSFRFTSLESAGAAAQEIKIDNLKVAIFRTLEEFTLVAAAGGVYARPAAKNFPTIDAVLLPSAPNAPVMFLQMTVSKDHPVKAAPLKKLRDALPPLFRERPVQFVFVVPDDIESGFTKQPFHTLEGTVTQKPPTDVSQCLLTVRLAM